MPAALLLDHERRPTPTFHDVYFLVLLGAVAAYAFTGKGFAYAGIPPLFPGEIVLLLGLLTLLFPHPSLAVFFNVPHLLLVLLMGWTLLRTIPYLGAYRVDALRDSVIVIYGVFALVAANLILEKTPRISLLIGYAARFFAIYGLIAAFLYVFPKQLNAVIPQWPGSGTPMISLRGGEVAVHLGGAAAFAILGLKRSSLFWVCTLMAGIAVVSAQSRGGMLAILVPAILAVALSGRFRAVLLIALAAMSVAAVLYVADFEIPLPPDHRTVRVGQILDNVGSIFVSSGDEVLDGTKMWRLRWWETILDYTVRGPYFWTGKGFGVNLAISDGFVGTNQEGPPLRSPHNAHMTILARAGVPGLALWISLHLAWAGMMLRSIYLSRMRGDVEWSSVLIFVLCYVVGILVNSSFDVALEGPMVGILFWTLFGTGVGLSMTYRSLCEERRREGGERP